MSSTSVFPAHLLNEWHPIKNNGKKLTDFSKGSSRKVWWLGDCGHEWETTIVKRVKNNSGCPFCAGRLVLAGFNDLATTHPDVASRFVSSKTAGKSPFNVKGGSDAVFIWKGSCGHEWERRVSHEVGLGKESCRVCNHKVLLVGFNDFGTLHPEHAKDWNYEKNKSTPESFIGAGRKTVWWKCNKNHEWKASLDAKIKLKNCPTCIKQENEKFLISNFPKLIKEWHPTKNGKLKPGKVSKGSKQKVWWLGECGHEWESSPRSRAGNNPDTKIAACPICVNRKLVYGINDVATIYPDISKFWDYKKNTLKPKEVITGSNKIFWLKCNQGHEWSIRPAQLKGKIKCPACSKTITSKQLFSGVNDLATTHPELAKEWHPTKNGDLKPEQVRSLGGKKVWWLGKCGHEWKASIYLRKGGTTCPVCSGHKIVSGINDLTTINPTASSEWHPTKNGDLKPNTLSAGSAKKVWWKCEDGHEWEAKITYRKRSGCPVCGKLVSKAEIEVREFVKSLGFEVEANVRGLLADKRNEVDIWIPSKRVAIEYNGLYWHSEKHKSKDFHYNKWLAANQQGIQLIQIWEDEWLNNPEQVKLMLSHKLGVSSQRKVFARKTSVVELSYRQVKDFFDVNHIQGATTASFYTGLSASVDGVPVLVAVLASKWEKDRKTLNIVRYATSMNVVGGFTKLLKFVEKTYKPERFVTFSDHCISDGGLYANNGFVADKELPPDYMYIVNGSERKHKFGYRLKRFQNDPELKYEAGLSEHQLALLNGLYRVYDAGKTRWVKKV